MTMTATRSLRIGDREVPVVLPNRRDPRLHTAAVILTVHALGITTLGFEVSVPQILSAIVTAGLIDVTLTYRRTRHLVWPASGMLTGSGVALILRFVETDAGEYWSWDGWHWFAVVAGVSVLTKYLIRRKGVHVFNPSNLGLVLAFLIVGSNVLEPLDFWWASLDPWMALTYIVIVGGGAVITRRLRLLEMAAVFWVVFVASLGVLAASGHCMVATWSTTPVCGARFWTTLVTSPEVLIFLFFMITDPKTIPEGRSARTAFAGSLAVFTTIMIAPHTLEFGAKVGLLSSLVLWSPLRWWFDRSFAETEPEKSGLRSLFSRLSPPGSSPPRVFARGLATGSIAALLGLLVVAAGTPSRETALAAESDEVQVEVDAGSIPTVVVDSSLSQIDLDIDQVSAQDLATTLAENLALEGEAMRYLDASRLVNADGGRRLTAVQASLDNAVTSGFRPVDTYSLDTLALRVAGESEGQTSAALAFDALGSVTQVTYDSTGVEVSSHSRPLEATFIMRQLAGERWLIVDVIEG